MRVTLAAFAALLLAAGCGNDPAPSKAPTTSATTKSAAELLDESATALQGEQWAAALTAADAVLADAKATGEEKARAWIDKITATTHANGDEAGKAAVAAMVASGATPTAEQFAATGIELANADHPKVALDLLDVATKRFGDDPETKKKLKKVAGFCQRKFEESGDSAALDELRKLGYLGTEGEDEEE